MLSLFLTQSGDGNMAAARYGDQPPRGGPNRKFEALAKALTGLGAGKRTALPGKCLGLELETSVLYEGSRGRAC
jgi:hypothetical protein